MDIKQEIPFPVPIDNILIGNGLAPAFCNYLGNASGGGKVLIICDENTKDFVKFNAEKIVFPSDGKASLEAAGKIPAGYDLYAAVGSGTINDITKYASYIHCKPYIVFATAASMNGYASGNSSLLDGGYKKSFTAQPPKAIFMDTGVISTAPARLKISGIGDAYCRKLTENDNILANALRGDKYHYELFRLMDRYEDKIFSDISALCKTLIFGGVAMYVAGSSVPASGAEHMIAHYMELMHPETFFSLHGEQIAVCTVAMAKLQENILRQNKFSLREVDNILLREHFANSGEADYFLKETAAKFSTLSISHLEASRFHIPSAEAMEEKLKDAGAPTTPEQLGWTRSSFEEAIEYAAFTRNRITFLDLAA